MTIASMFEGAGIDQAVYDGFMEAMGLGDPDGGYPAGLLVHLAGPAPDGVWRVVDVWESEQAASTFYDSDGFAPVRESGWGDHKQPMADAIGCPRAELCTSLPDRASCARCCSPRCSASSPAAGPRRS